MARSTPQAEAVRKGLTKKQQDKSSVTWRLDRPLLATPGTQLRLRAMDIDLMAHDLIESLSASVPGELAGGRLELSGGGATLVGRCRAADGGQR